MLFVSTDTIKKGYALALILSLLFQLQMLFCYYTSYNEFYKQLRLKESHAKTKMEDTNKKI